MSKCFITKLPSSVDNNNLPVLGQLRINWLKKDSLKDNGTRAIGLSTNDSITIKVSGAHLTDNTLSSNLGNSKTITKDNGLVWLYVSNDADAILTIDNKYALTVLDFGFGNSIDSSENIPAYFDIEDIKYCTNLITLDISNTQIGGDISAVSNMTNMQILLLRNTQIGGDISAVSNMTNMQRLSLGNTQIGGDISVISNMTNIKALDLSYTNVSGNVDSLARCIGIGYLTGLKGISLVGDMSKIPAQVLWISQQNRKINTNFTWTAKGRQNATLLAMEGYIPFDTVSMDNMLIDQATCKLSQDIYTEWQKVIAVSGTRTSASDAAVTTLQNMGVTISGVTKQA